MNMTIFFAANHYIEQYKEALSERQSLSFICSNKVSKKRLKCLSGDLELL